MTNTNNIRSDLLVKLKELLILKKKRKGLDEILVLKIRFKFILLALITYILVDSCNSIVVAFIRKWSSY